MKRIAFLVPVVLALCLTAQAKLKTGDRAKLAGYLVTYTNPQLAGDDQEKGLRDFVDWFGQGGRSKELADVSDMEDLLASSAVRPNQSSGVRTKEMSPFGSDLKVTCTVSIPRKYSGGKDTDAWPLVYCLPDKGMKPADYLDKHWSGPVRDTCVIAVLDVDYTEKEVETRKTVQDDSGKIRFENVKEKIPFAWDSDDIFLRFWGGMKALMLFEFKINPNRVILDGAGAGADGVLYFASRQSWRFAGLVLRGGTLTGPSIANLAHLPTLVRPGEIADEAGKKGFEETRKALAELLKERLVDGAAMDEAAVAGWVGNVRRERYPLPQKWVHENPAQQWGYWVGVLGAFEPEKPSTVTVSADRAAKRVDVRTENVSELRLFVNDIIVDMEQPFDLYVNGELHRGKVVVSRSALQLLAHAFEKSPVDPGVVFPGEIADMTIAPPKAPGDGAKPGDGKEKAPEPKEKGEEPKEKAEEPKEKAPEPKDKGGEK